MLISSSFVIEIDKDKVKHASQNIDFDVAWSCLILNFEVECYDSKILTTKSLSSWKVARLNFEWALLSLIWQKKQTTLLTSLTSEHCSSTRSTSKWAKLVDSTNERTSIAHWLTLRVDESTSSYCYIKFQHDTF